MNGTVSLYLFLETELERQSGAWTKKKKKKRLAWIADYGLWPTTKAHPGHYLNTTT
jgi:hypothetical protein